MEKFLVLSKHEDGESAMLMSEHEIIDRIDMIDCSNEELEVYMVKFGEKPKMLHVRGAWHMIDDPLYIALADDDGRILVDGYGSDH